MARALCRNAGVQILPAYFADLAGFKFFMDEIENRLGVARLRQFLTTFLSSTSS